MRFCLALAGLVLLTGCTPPAGPHADVEQPAGTTTAAGPSAAPTLEPGPFDDLRMGKPPRVPFVRGHVLVRPDGSRLRFSLPLRGEWGVSRIVELPDGFVAADDRFFEGTVGMYRLDAQGRVLESWSGTSVVSGPGRTAAWATVVPPESGLAGAIQLHTDERTQDLQRLIWPVVGSYDGQTVHFSALVPVGRRWERRGFATDLRHPPYRAPITGPRTPSPDGRHWFMTRRRSLVIGGAAGEVSLPLRPFAQGVLGLLWEDNRHLLATLTRRSRQTIVRIHVEGTVTLASGWSRARYAGFAFLG